MLLNIIPRSTGHKPNALGRMFLIGRVVIMLLHSLHLTKILQGDGLHDQTYVGCMTKQIFLFMPAICDHHVQLFPYIPHKYL